MRFLSAKKALKIRDKHGIGLKIRTVDENNDDRNKRLFLLTIMIAKSKERKENILVKKLNLKIWKMPKQKKGLKGVSSQQFQVNEFLTLKLEDDKTFIYIKGKKFIQCIRLFLQISPQDINLYEEVDSIDEATEIYKHSLWQNRIVEGPMAKPSRFQNRTITPEQEFWGHCSNLQVWAEHDYDTRIIHSNLAFQLLKELTQVGDPKAKAMFKEEIAIRYESGYFPVMAYLIEQGYLLFLDKDYLRTLLENNLILEDQFTANKALLTGYSTLLIKMGDYLKAIKMLKDSLKIDPKFIKAHFLLGITYGLLRDLKLMRRIGLRHFGLDQEENVITMILYTTMEKIMQKKKYIE